jgi:hypothetical protein
VRQDVQRSAYASAGLTFLMGLLVLAAPALAGTGLTILLAASFLIDALQRAVELWHGRDRRTTLTLALAVAGNMALAIFLLVLWRRSTTWTIALAGALRIVGVGWNMVTSPVHARDGAGGGLGWSAQRRASRSRGRLRIPGDWGSGRRRRLPACPA